MLTCFLGHRSISSVLVNIQKTEVLSPPGHAISAQRTEYSLGRGIADASRQAANNEENEMILRRFEQLLGTAGRSSP